MAPLVVICDDEPDIRLLYRQAFEDLGVEVAEAADGEECLAVVDQATEPPALVVLDLFMPRRDGFATLPELRERCPGCPVVVVTAHAAVDVFDKSRARGAVACFDKLGFLQRVPRLVDRFCRAA